MATKYTSFDDYKKPNGDIDWDAYHKAQVKNGERCYVCGAYVMFATGHTTSCSDCRSLATDKDRSSHKSFVRCPKCQHRENVWDDEGPSLRHGAEEMDMSCGSCGYSYTVGVDWVVTFTSPELLEPEKKEDEEYDEDDTDDNESTDTGGDEQSETDEDVQDVQPVGDSEESSD